MLQKFIRMVFFGQSSFYSYKEQKAYEMSQEVRKEKYMQVNGFIF